MKSYESLVKQLSGITSKQVLSELARRHFADFVQYTKPDYTFNWHHIALCKKLEAFAKGEIKRLMIFMPPQHGKTELTTRRLPAYMLGRNPALKISIVSYGATIAEGFSRDIQQIIESPLYQDVFPDTYLATAKDLNYVRKDSEFDVLPGKGKVVAVGSGGPLTSKTVDVSIVDDPFKDREDAQSPKMRSKVKNHYIDVIRTRLHNNSQELLVMTRWDPEDIAGYLLEAEGKEWEVIIYQGIKDRNIPGDPRKIGQALWPEKHSLERLLKVKQTSPVTFNSLYQQEPQASQEVLVYPSAGNSDECPGWDEVEKMPGCYPVVYGLDFGFSNDPTVIVAIESHKNDVWIDEIVYKPGMLNNDIKKACMANGIKSQRIIADTDEKDITELSQVTVDADTMQKLYKLNIVAAVKGPGSVERQTNVCRKLRIHVTTRSHNIKRELKKYQFVMHGSVKTNEIIDANNHAMDAWRYAYISYKLLSKIRV